MTGGVAYLTEWRQLNTDSVVAREVPAEDAAELHKLVEEHQRRTGSVRAAAMLADWGNALRTFRQLVPVAAVQAPAAPEPAATEQRTEVPKAV
jgi:glutamate synthase domain-containing protein 3